MERQNLKRDPHFEGMHLQWFGDGDPPPDPAPEPDPQPAPEGRSLSADGTWAAQLPDRFKKDPEKLKDLLRHKNLGELVDRLYASEEQTAAHQASLTDLQAKLTAAEARALEKGGSPAPAEYTAADYGKVAPGALPEFMTQPMFKAYSENLGVYLKAAGEEIKALAQELKLSPAVAQRLLNFHTQKQVESFRAGLEDVDQRRQKALDRLKAEWKGDFPANEDLARRALATFGGPALADEIAAAGFADHPVMLRIFRNIGAAIGEGQMVPGRPAPTPGVAPGLSDREAQQAASNAKRYPTMRQGA